jgi:exodeoxyribonuclease V gamma subunit
MLELYTAGGLRTLAHRLGEVLAHPLPDPMAQELVTVPSAGVRTWLSLELARRLGTGRPTTAVDGLPHDGVSANISFPFPGVLRRRVLDAWSTDLAGDSGALIEDPWSIERLVWRILDATDPASPAPTPGFAVPRLLVDAPAGASRYAAARQVADLFDGYHVHRAAMVMSWSKGLLLDELGEELPARHRWQPELWRLVRSRLDTPSPPERMDVMLERLRTGEAVVDLPSRVCLFGMSMMPGGSGFLELAEAIAVERDVHLFVVEPSTPLWGRRLAARSSSSPKPPPAARRPRRTRADLDSLDAYEHPLLRSWGRLHHETVEMLVDLAEAGTLRFTQLDEAHAGAPESILGRLQAGIRSDLPPDPAFVPSVAPGGQHAIELHACHGPGRQVEVLRDAILRLLVDHPHLHEDDILVVCPALERFAPLIEAVFGEPAATGSSISDEDGAALRYRLADLSLGDSVPLIGAFRSLIELVGGRFDAPSVLDFLALDPVRRRFGLDDDALGVITRLVTDVHIRFGLDSESRAGPGVPPGIDANSWQSGVDRLLVGAVVPIDPTAPLTESVGGVVPYGVEGSDIRVVGVLADILYRLSELAEAATSSRPVGDWMELVSRAAIDFLEPSPEQSWQQDRLLRSLGQVVDSATLHDVVSGTMLTFVDLRRLLADRLDDPEHGRPAYLRGGITICSLAPMRWVPHKVIVMLGMDAPALSSGAGVGDDLLALTPCVGDPDRRGELRQSLLETVLSAGEHLVVIRDGHDVRTNQEIPMAVPVAELFDSVVAMVHPEQRERFVEGFEVHHPRQPFDESYFANPDPPSVLDSQVGAPPRSFDAGAARAAQARRCRAIARSELLDRALDPVDLSEVALVDLHRFLKHPIRYFLERRLELRLPRDQDAPSGTFPTAVAGLDAWRLGSELLELRMELHLTHLDRSGSGLEDALLALTDAWKESASRTGAVPPGLLGAGSLDDISEQVALMCDQALSRGVGSAKECGSVPVAVDATCGSQVVGEVELRLVPAALGPGPARVSFTRRSAEVELSTLLDLAVLTLADPGPEWHAVLATRAGEGKNVCASTYRLDGRDPLGVAQRFLDLVVDLHRRSLSEPLPLFKGLSEALHRKPGELPEWPRRHSDAAEMLAYGHLRASELCEMSIRSDDPPGEAADRARRYADHLYGALASSLVEVEQ